MIKGRFSETALKKKKNIVDDGHRRRVSVFLKELFAMKKVSSCPRRLGARWEMCWLLFLARGVCQANRVLLGALMPYLSSEVSMSSQEKGSILAAFSTGYMLTQVIGGAASDRFGGKLLTLFAIIMMSLGSLAAAPLLTLGGLQPFWCCYFLMGLAEGPSYPTTGSMLSKWIPSHERGAAISIVDTGSSVASMLTFAFAPYFASRYGWRMAFHTFGGFSLVICAIFAYAAANKPAENSRVSVEERAYLRDSGLPSEDVYPAFISEKVADDSGLKTSTVTAPLSSDKKKKASPSDKEVPSEELLVETSSLVKDSPTSANHRLKQHSFNLDALAKATSETCHNEDEAASTSSTAEKNYDFPFRLFTYSGAWAVIMAHAAFNFGRYFVYNSIVSFYVDVTEVSPVVAGQQVLLGQIADTLGKFLFAGYVDRAIKRDPSAKTFVRKIVSSSSFFVFGLSMIAMGHSTSVAHVTLALVIAKIACSAHVCGFKTTYLDLSSRHTGALTGVSNTVATLSAMISPLATGFFLGLDESNNQANTLTGWRRMFYLIAAVNFAAAILWSAFASSDSLDDKIKIKRAA